ncbi:hypothetical protein [Mesobacillus boroniphilus]|uniref:hypothetical protein n=1 Tax=Mesobacillus boroniphilus TaxID=308892 RepID=UPI00068A4520|nr:hypothetical protein [Mesobacillus boroniphilus]
MNHEPEHGSGSHHSHSQQENLTGESNHAETTHDTSDHNQPHNMHDSHAAHHGHGQLSGELNAAKVLVEWTSNPEPIQSNQETDIFLDVKDASGKAVEIFPLSMKKKCTSWLLKEICLCSSIFILITLGRAGSRSKRLSRKQGDINCMQTSCLKGESTAGIA